MNRERIKKNRDAFNSSHDCYLSADGKYYCYEFWDDDVKRMVTQRLEVGKDLSVELAVVLDESDHDIDLQDYYERELRDPLFEASVNRYISEFDNENAINPWDTLVDKGVGPEDALFDEEENSEATQACNGIDEGIC